MSTVFDKYINTYKVECKYIVLNKHAMCKETQVNVYMCE